MITRLGLQCQTPLVLRFDSKVKNFGSKHFGSQKNLAPKKISTNNFEPEKNFGLKKNFGSKQNFRSDKFWV